MNFERPVISTFSAPRSSGYTHYAGSTLAWAQIYLPNPPEGDSLGGDDEGGDSDSEPPRPFPFDKQTCDYYDTPFWHTRTGVGELAQVLLHSESDLILMLSLHVDGSGENRKGTFVLGGYLADTWDWFELERLWSAELRKAPAIDFFKASSCVRRLPDNEFKKPFKGWPDDAVAEKRLRLAEIINKVSPAFVELSSTIRWDEYDSVIGNDVMSATFYHPYFLCFHGLLSLTVERLSIDFPRQRQSGRIAVVIDTESNADLDVDVETQYKKARETLPEGIAKKLGSFTIDNDIDFPMLQPPDLAMWSTRSDREGFPSPVLDIIREQGRIRGAYEAKWNPAKLAQFIVDTEKEFRRQWPNAPAINLNKHL
jgi:hypothetical protein